jgi:hypothetical protein
MDNRSRGHLVGKEVSELPAAKTACAVAQRLHNSQNAGDEPGKGSSMFTTDELYMIKVALAAWVMEMERRQETKPLPKRPDRIRRYRTLACKVMAVRQERLARADKTRSRA